MRVYLLIFIFSGIAFCDDFRDFEYRYSKTILSEHYLFTDMEEVLDISSDQKNQIISKYGDDINFKKGFYYLTERQMESSLDSSLGMVDYINTLKFFHLSSKKDNLLASYAGLKVLKSNFLMKNNRIGQKYLRDMVYPLAKEEYINPMYWYGKSYLAGWSLGEENVNYKKAIRVMERVIKKIKRKEKRNELKKIKLSLYDKMNLRQAKKVKSLSKSMLYLIEEHRKKMIKKNNLKLGDK